MDALHVYAIAVAISAGVDPGIFVAQIGQESGWNPNAVSPAGAKGLAQFMPGTAASVGLGDPFDPHASLSAAAQLDASLLARYHGDYALMLAAYNAGAGAVDRSGPGIPPYAETQRYVAAILPSLGSIASTPSTPGAAAAAPGVALPSWWPAALSLPTSPRTVALVAIAALGAFYVLGDL